MGRILVILRCLPGAGSRAQWLQGLGSDTAIPAGEAPIQETGEAGCKPEAGRTVPTDPWEQGMHRAGWRGAAAAASTELLVKQRVLPRAPTPFQPHHQKSQEVQRPKPSSHPILF